MSTILIFVALGFILGGVIGYAIGHSQPKQNQGISLTSIIKDATALVTAL